MHLVKIATFAALSLLLAGCKTISVTPHASTISSSEIAAEQFIKNSKKLGNVAIYFEGIDLKAKAYARIHTGAHFVCPSLNHNVDLTAAYLETIRSGFGEAFDTVEFVTAPLSFEQMKAKNIQAQIQLGKPTAAVSYTFFHKGLSIDLQGFAELSGKVTAYNQAGTIQQKVMNVEDKDELLELSAFSNRCDAETVGILIQNAATKTIFNFALKNIAASKDMVSKLNSKN